MAKPEGIPNDEIRNFSDRHSEFGIRPSFGFLSDFAIRILDFFSPAMLKLRKEHLDAFEAQVVSLFTLRVVTHVKAVWPSECGELGDAVVAEMVRNGIQRAATLGLSAEHDIVRFVDLAFMLAKDFDTNPL